MAQSFDPGSWPKAANRAARLRLWIISVGLLVIAAIAGSSAYDAWLSYRHSLAATDREITLIVTITIRSPKRS